MSDNKHTPEPIFQYDFNQLVRFENGCTPILLTEDQYRRAKACVNACAGISTENLEDNISIKELARRYNETLKQRDELLAALELSKIELEKARYHLDGETHCDATMAIINAEEAIASVKANHAS